MRGNEIPIWEKYCLTVEEAAAYSNIGENLLRARIEENNYDFVLRKGNRTLIKRKQFEDFIDSTNVI